MIFSRLSEKMAFASQEIEMALEHFPSIIKLNKYYKLNFQLPKPLINFRRRIGRPC